MGFETQEEAERWAENMEFCADQAKEEKLLASAVQSNEQTLEQMARLLDAKIVSPKDALKAAYTLGQFDGKLEMALATSRRD
jgi:hypothetical protein